jgi:putative endonuclease
MIKKDIKSVGKLGEDVAVAYLIAKGYNIIERNLYSRYGEIDIIASIDSFVVFVEVKYRKNSRYGTPSMAVNLKKQEKMKKTALHYIGLNEIVDKDFRFDIIEVMGVRELKINHIDNAFY